MARHRTVVVGTTGAYQGRCACRARGSVTETHAEAMSWCDTHLKAVERARTMHGSASLADQRDYYRRMIEDPEVSDEDRALWTQLAEELDHRLGTDHPIDTPPMF